MKNPYLNLGRGEKKSLYFSYSKTFTIQHFTSGYLSGYRILPPH
jgi:hypothetical protein